jgi:hypothetical protein
MPTVTIERGSVIDRVVQSAISGDYIAVKVATGSGKVELLPFSRAGAAAMTTALVTETARLEPVDPAPVAGSAPTLHVRSIAAGMRQDGKLLLIFGVAEGATMTFEVDAAALNDLDQVIEKLRILFDPNGRN